MLKKPLLFLFMLTWMLYACQSRYGYLSKVKVGSSTQQKAHSSKADKSILEIDVEIEGEITASNDSTVIILNHSLFKNDKEVKSHLSNKPREREIGNKKSTQMLNKAKDRKVNYYAKWALIMGLISLLTVPFIIPIFFGPLDILLGIVALKQISKRGEKGKGRAIFAIVVGIIASAFLLFVFIESTFLSYPFLPMPYMFLIALGVLVYNFLWFIIIKKGRKNPANQEEVNKKVPIDDRTKRLLKFTFFFAILTGLFSAILLGLAFGPLILIFAQTALQRMPKYGRILRFITQMVLVLGILASMALLVVLYLLLAGIMVDYVFIIISAITLIMALILTIIAFATKMNYYLEDEY